MQFLFKLLFIAPIILSADEYVLSLGELGSIRYTYGEERLLQVDRLSPSERVMYSHTYQYDSEGKLLAEGLIGNLGTITYEGGVVRSPYCVESFAFDDQEKLIRYSLDGVSRENYMDDCTEYCEYDAAGRLIRTGNTEFVYDDQDRLLQVESYNCTVTYAYGLSGERISRTVNGETEHYLYLGENEIAILDTSGKVKELRIPGLSLHKNIIRPIAIETPTAVYAPIHDIQGNIVKLVNIASREMLPLACPDQFGRGLSKDSPTSWIFSGKYFDRDAGLVYFGHRSTPKGPHWGYKDPNGIEYDLFPNGTWK